MSLCPEESDSTPTPEQPPLVNLEPIRLASKYPSTIILTNVGYIGKITNGFSISSESTCLCCKQSTCCAVTCLPWYCCEVCFCHIGFCTDASVKLDDTTKTIGFTSWNWYLPCLSCSESISYDKIADVGYHRIEYVDATIIVVKIAESSPKYNFVPTNKHTSSLYHPMLKTTTNKLYKFKTGTCSSAGFNEKWIVSNLTDSKDISKPILTSTEAIIGMHHFFLAEHFLLLIINQFFPQNMLHQILNMQI